MLFNSYAFAIFAPVVLLTAALLRGRALRLWLIVMSYVFYGWAEPSYCLLLLASTVLDYHVARWISKSDSARRRKSLLCLSIIGNLGMLASFKYLGFFTQTIQRTHRAGRDSGRTAGATDRPPRRDQFLHIPDAVGTRSMCTEGR